MIGRRELSKCGLLLCKGFRARRVKACVLPEEKDVFRVCELVEREVGMRGEREGWNQTNRKLISEERRVQ